MDVVALDAESVDNGNPFLTDYVANTALSTRHEGDVSLQLFRGPPLEELHELVSGIRKVGLFVL